MGERINHFIERFGGFVGGEPLLKKGEGESVDSGQIKKNKTLFEPIKRLRKLRKTP